MNTTTPSIYVADLAAYNNATLHGVWIDLTNDLDDVQNQIQIMLSNSPEENAEEYAIHDFEGFSGYRVDEWDSISQLKSIADLIEDFGPVVGALLNEYEVNQITEVMEEGYCGIYESLEDYAYELYNECFEIPEHLACYIDYEKIARDLSYDGYYAVSVDGECHIFRPV